MVLRLFSWWTFAAANIPAALPLDLNGESHGKALPDQQEDSAERRSRSGHGGQLTAAIRSL
jgi:hypothetical protein